MFKLSSMVVLLLSFAAPLVSANPASPGCNRWRHRSDIQGGGLIKSMTSRDSHWCKKECTKVPECVAVTWQWRGKKCSLYRAAHDARIGDSKTKHTFVFCPTCNRRMRHQKIEHGEEVMPPFQIKDIHWCGKKCMNTEDCNAYNWGPNRMCTLLNIKAGVFKTVTDKKYWSMVICNKYSLLPVCGSKGDLICHSHPQCDPGLSITSEQTCDCGNEWEQCCPAAVSPDACDAGLGCNAHSKQCEPCGGQWQQCCADEQCNSDDGQNRVCLHKQCRPCGGQWQDVCAGRKKCDHGLMPDMNEGKQCVMMGADK